jgi:hypothetical protein
MPRILREKHRAAWLGETEDGNLKELLLPFCRTAFKSWIAWEHSLRFKYSATLEDQPRMKTWGESPLQISFSALVRLNPA